MPLGINDLDRVIEEMTSRICIENQQGTLEEFLAKVGMQHLLTSGDSYGIENDPFGRIIILGEPSVKEDILRGVAKDMGFSKARFTFLDYKETKGQDCRDWQYNPSISAIMCGPVPHKTTGMGDSSSLLEALRSQPGYAPVEELRDVAGDLKITKTAFRDGLVKLIGREVAKQDC